MRPRANRRTERAAVNAARAFFEAHDCVFQEVDGANDYGKDAYVDIGEPNRITGTCTALQIKGGSSFRSAGGDYRISIDDDHRQVWIESTVPIIALVHDPDDGLLRWGNVSELLRKHPDAKAIRIPADQLLDAHILRTAFVESIRSSAGGHPAGVLSQVLDDDENTSIAGVFDAFAIGRNDPRVLVGLRYLLKALAEKPRRAAIHALSHATPHPDIIWHEGNWIPDNTKAQLRKHFRWSPDDVTAILEAAPLGTFERGEIGESAYMLLQEDPNAQKVVTDTAIVALRAGNTDVAESALYLVLYWLGRKAPSVLQSFLNDFPEARRLPHMREIQVALADFGYLSMF
jgi:Domain of unknown function (DUF4365)